MSAIDWFGRKLIQSRLRPVMNPALQAWGRYNAKRYDIHHTIVVASSPRGGSTWLAEIVATLPGYSLIWEPLSWGNNPESRQYGFYPDTYMPSGADDVVKREYLHQVLTGARLSANLIGNHFHLSRLIDCKGFVVKFVRGNLLLYWILEQFPVQAVLLVRHPCAVVSSQLQWSWEDVKDGRWKTAVKQGIWQFPPSLSANYPHLLEIYQTIETVEECMAFDWALQTYIPLSQSRPHPWYLTTYERLVRERTQEVDRIFDYLERPVPQEAHKRLNMPSVTVHPNSHFAQKGDPLAGWQSRLSARQIKEILDIVQRVGIDFYDDGLLPDYNKLSKWI